MRFVLCWLAIGLFGCGNRRVEIDKPTPPDMSDVVRAYQAPAGVFEPGSAGALVDRYGVEAARALEIGLHDQVVPWLRTALREANEDGESAPSSAPVGVTSAALSLNANGTMLVERICPGWETEPAPDPAHGRVLLRVNFSEQGLDPVAWADAEACQYRATDAVDVRIDEGSGRTPGDVRIWLGDAATVTNFGEQPLIFDIDLEAESSGVALPFVANFRLDPSGLLAFAIDAEPGHVVISPTSASTLSVVASNGTFECDLVASQCVSDRGETFGF